MTTPSLHAVTGAFGYTGKYIAQRLLALGKLVISLTNSIDRANAFDGSIQAFPYNFNDPARLAHSLQNVSVLYNTYWVRFNHPLFTHADAVRNTLLLFHAAKQAGVRRIVHLSITNPSIDSPLEYFRGKAYLEESLINSGLEYAILRPTVIFGKEDILINNIAWVLRHFPLFGVFGDGRYQLQPIYVEDLASLAVRYGDSQENIILDAIGPETFTYRAMVEMIGRQIGTPRRVVSIPPGLGYQVARLIGLFTGDVVITRPEIEGLMANLLVTTSPPAGRTCLTDWVGAYRATLGQHYTSELRRRVDRRGQYQSN